MIESTRRGFLGLLAHLPLVGVVFASVPRKRTADDERLQLLTDEALRNAQAEVRFIRWVPVSERLPESEREVIVTTSDGFVKTAWLEDFGGGLEWCCGEAAHPLNSYTHWAELPAPPTERPA